MNKKTLSLMTAAALLSAGAFGQDSTVFKLKNRSVFNGTQVARDPFWPIGWRKSADSQVVGESDFSPDEFVVTAILLSPPALAVINGKEYGEGQFIPLPGGGAKAQVAAIQDGRVVFLYHGKTVTSVLRRNEHLSTPKPFDPADPSSVQAAVSPP